MGLERVGYEGITREEYYRMQESGEDIEGKLKIRKRAGLGPTTARGSSQ